MQNAERIWTKTVASVSKSDFGLIYLNIQPVSLFQNLEDKYRP